MTGMFLNGSRRQLARYCLQAQYCSRDCVGRLRVKEYPRCTAFPHGTATCSVRIPAHGFEGASLSISNHGTAACLSFQRHHAKVLICCEKERAAVRISAPKPGAAYL